MDGREQQREKLQEEPLQGFSPGAVVVGFVAGVRALGVGCHRASLADSGGLGGRGFGCAPGLFGILSLDLPIFRSSDLPISADLPRGFRSSDLPIFRSVRSSDLPDLPIFRSSDLPDLPGCACSQRLERGLVSLSAARASVENRLRGLGTEDAIQPSFQLLQLWRLRCARGALVRLRDRISE